MLYSTLDFVWKGAALGGERLNQDGLRGPRGGLPERNFEVALGQDPETGNFEEHVGELGTRWGEEMLGDIEFDDGAGCSIRSHPARESVLDNVKGVGPRPDFSGCEREGRVFHNKDSLGGHLVRDAEHGPIFLCGRWGVEECGILPVEK